MDLLKKHLEKFTLAVALILLIAFGTYFALSVGKLKMGIGSAPSNGKQRTATVGPLNISSYTGAVAELTTPVLWSDMPADPFLGWPTNVINPIAITSTPKTVRTEAQFELLNVEYLPFKLLFRAYSWDANKQHAYNLQINFIDQALTFFVPEVGQEIADRYRSTGYRVTNFERLLTNITDNVGQREIDVSRLSIRRDEEEPIILVLNRITTQPEPIATIRIRGEPQVRRVRRNQTIESDGKQYNVVDITSKQMLILDAQSKGNKPIVVLRNPSGYDRSLEDVFPVVLPRR